jgi:hypothetical protein
MSAKTYREYVAVQATDLFYQIYTEQTDDEFRRFLETHAPLSLLDNVTITRPSLSWPLLTYDSDGKPVRVPKLIVGLSHPQDEAEPVLHSALSELASGDVVVLGRGADPGAGDADHWCPIAPDQSAFGTRAAARGLIGADLLGQPPLSGREVNVVVIDRGLNQQEIEDRFGVGRYGGGWPFTPQPGDPRPSQLPGQTSVEDAAHGLMIARNILDIAPEAVIWDLPLLPPRITNIPLFLSEANAAFIAMLNDVDQRGGSWILTNAWAVFDRQSETPLGSYTENLPSPTTLHPFTQEIADAIDHKHDVIFCAGNCGEFCPDPRCGPADRGAGRSIWGANSYYRVLTVSAARTDGAWIGYSSQGPGQPNLSSPTHPGFSQKPDLCAPSGFREDGDAHRINTGTSAASGITAGVVAALRSKWPPQAIKPEILNLILNATARQPLPGSWNQRFGNGLLNIPQALAMLP